jgi:transglutaminase-like putative cysteine protease
MRLRITHVTGFEYDDLVRASYNEARMTPQTDATQTVAHARIDVSPHPWAQTFRDYWGTTVTAFEVLDPHRELVVTATSTVATGAAPAPPATPATWAQVTDGQVADELLEYLTVDGRVRPPEDLAARVRAVIEEGAAPRDVVREVCRLVHQEVDYVPGSTDVHAEAAAAWRQRSGVCQDFAHLVVGALRGAGIPARYVSGYLLPTTEPVIGEETHGESHAWVDWWEEGWRSFDPTNDQATGERHVAVARGRDYTDVRPLSGIYTGAATSRMFVDVQITRLG